MNIENLVLFCLPSSNQKIITIKYQNSKYIGNRYRNNIYLKIKMSKIILILFKKLNVYLK